MPSRFLERTVDDPHHHQVTHTPSLDYGSLRVTAYTFAAHDRREYAVQLDPGTYPCPLHQQIDLTSLIVEALEEHGPPVVFGWNPFRVPVTCRGDNASGAHQQVCAGKYQP
jgi:hypothetical protein